MTVSVFREALEREGFNVRDIDYEDFVAHKCPLPVDTACVLIDADNLNVEGVVKQVDMIFPDTTIVVVSGKFTTDDYGPIAGIKVIKVRKPVSDHTIARIVDTTTKYRAVTQSMRLVHISTAKLQDYIKGVTDEHDSDKVSSR
jgi:hypothetical protein